MGLKPVDRLLLALAAVGALATAVAMAIAAQELAKARNDLKNIKLF